MGKNNQIALSENEKVLMGYSSGKGAVRMVIVIMALSELESSIPPTLLGTSSLGMLVSAIEALFSEMPNISKATTTINTRRNTFFMFSKILSYPSLFHKHCGLTFDGTEFCISPAIIQEIMEHR